MHRSSTVRWCARAAPGAGRARRVHPPLAVAHAVAHLPQPQRPMRLASPLTSSVEGEPGVNEASTASSQSPANSGTGQLRHGFMNLHGEPDPAGMQAGNQVKPARQRGAAQPVHLTGKGRLRAGDIRTALDIYLAAVNVHVPIEYRPHGQTPLPTDITTARTGAASFGGFGIRQRTRRPAIRRPLRVALLRPVGRGLGGAAGTVG